jgi:hypothetical protein
MDSTKSFLSFISFWPPRADLEGGVNVSGLNVEPGEDRKSIDRPERLRHKSQGTRLPAVIQSSNAFSEGGLP